MKNQFRTLLPLSLFLLQAPGALAQSSEEEELALIYGDKDTVSIATGTKQTLRRAPSVATVITAEDIAAMGAKDLDEVMETVPGVHVTRIAAFYFSSYSIRGINGNPINPQVLMLQNGIPTNSVYRGDKGQSWSGMPLENIARIEIIRGPGSALYGADAFSGVINIITKTAADTRGTEFGVRAGAFNSRDGWVQHGGQLGPISVAAYARVGHTDGITETITADAQSARDLNPKLNPTGAKISLAPGPVNTGYDTVDASVDLGYDKWRLRAGYKLRDNVGTGAGVNSALDPIGQEKNENITADLTWNDANFAQNWGMGFTGSYLHHSEDATNYNLSPPGTRFPTGTFVDGMIGSPGRWEQQMRISGYAAYSGFVGHNLRFGLGHEDLNMYETRTVKNFLLNTTLGPLYGVPVPTAMMNYDSIQPHLPPRQRLIDYLYVQDEWSLARDWTLTGGVRHDRYSDFGGTTNPRLALVWDASLDLTAKLLYGEAFRAPSFVEQYGINPVANGNPNLKPETIKTLEAAFSWQARKDALVNLSLFRYDMADLIRTGPNPAGGFMYLNTGKQHGSGTELEAVWDVNRSVRLTGNYSYQQSTDEATGQDAGYTPHHHLYLRGDWRLAGGWLTSAQIDHVADRKRAAGDTRPQVPDYTTLDLTVRTTQSKNQWGFAASLRNLFNADVREPTLPANSIPNDLPMAPRSVWLQATYKL